MASGGEKCPGSLFFLLFLFSVVSCRCWYCCYYDRAVIFFFTHPSLWLLIGGWESESKIGVMAMGNLFSLNDGLVIMILLVK